MPADRFLYRRRFFFFGSKVAFHFVGFHHQFEFFVLDFADFIFIAFDLMPDRLKFVVLARLILLGLEPGDALGASAGIEL